MIGIYKITNKINNNAYIGLSINIEKRWKNHIYRSKTKTNKEYDKVLYKAFRKYGINNFSFEVLEECKLEELYEKEKKWIKYYDTYHNGYNCSEGGEQNCDVNGEKHPNHKITEQDVRYIRELWASKTVSTREMYYEYKNRIGKSGFKKIYSWQTWKKILPELNTQENRDWHRNNLISYSNFGEKNCNSCLSDQEEKEIYNRWKQGEQLSSIYQDFNNKYSNLNSFKTCMYARFKKYK